MPMTPDQIIKEASHLPREQVAEVVDRLMLALDSAVEPEIEMAGRQEARHRLAELENGQVVAVPCRVRWLVSGFVGWSGGNTACFQSCGGTGIRRGGTVLRI